MKPDSRAWRVGCVLAAFLCLQGAVRGEVILQYFNTNYRELAQRMPELAEVGYGAIWLPPPTKGSGGLSVGYDLWDPFDLGSRDQRGSVKTRYGTEAELLRLIATAHRFGIRVYVDNIMNHRAFDVPGYSEYTPIDTYPGMVPEDFHLRVTAEGFYRKWDNVANWSDTWQVQYRNFSDLIDIAQESPDNGNFGTSEGDHIPKIKIVRHPDNPEWYDYHPTLGWVGFNSSNITVAVISNNPSFYEEDVNTYLIRAVRWLVDYTKIDGLRLDAVKHVPAYFFGEQWAGDKDASSAGYCGQAQWQFNMTRGFDDWDNHRDTVFDVEASYGRNDLMMFGEHLGEPPSFSEYVAAGMRLVDSQLHGFLNGNLGQGWGDLDGLDWPGAKGFSAEAGVSYAKSHDDDYATRPELQYAFYLTRLGLPNIYTDGNYQSETLGQSGGAFPRHSNTAYLGQFGDNRIPNLVYIHNHFARGPQWWDGGSPTAGQIPRWSDEDVVAFERRDKRENPSMDDADGTVLFFVMNDNYADGQYREISTSFRPNDFLWQYSTGGGNFFYTVPEDRKIKVIVPPGGYFVFSWRSPEESDLWSKAGGHPVTIRENGGEVGWISHERQDGPDGDPAFNPHGVPDENTEDYTYTWYVPRVTSSTNLDFVARVDGSAINVLMKLDGGMDLNGVTHGSGDPRDHPPGNDGSTAVFEGYEQATFIKRHYAEKFAAREIARNTIASLGAETYTATLGSPGFTIIDGAGPNDEDGTYTAEWMFHDPESTNDVDEDQFSPLPADATNATIYLWTKVGYALQVNNVVLYYTTDGGDSWPEGAGGDGIGTTKTIPFSYDHSEGSADWWTVEIPPLDPGTELRYKIGCYKQQNGDTTAVPYVAWNIPYPINQQNADLKKSMLGQWQITGFDAGNVVYRPHNDFSLMSTGLVEGFHVIRARPFLERGSGASIYNTFVQPFYYDASTPLGEIVYPSPGNSTNLTQNEYGVVVRTDPTVTEVWYHFDDSSTANDDAQTGQDHGNGTNASGADAWVEATQVTPADPDLSVYPDEWRFSYKNIPSGGSAAVIRVRLKELSSSTNMTYSDVDGHYTTLEQPVWADGPAYTLFVAFPQHDGDTVGEGYVMKAYFSKTLGGSGESETLKNRSLITIEGEVQGRDAYGFDWDVDDYHHALTYSLPDLYNGDPNYLHRIFVTHTNAAGGGVTLTADRYVKAWPTEAGPHVDIITPPEYDSDGKAYEIILPDVGSPAPEQRQFTIRVETDLNARNVWIAFTNSTGYTTPYESSSNALRGTVSVVQGTNTVVGHETNLSGTVSATYSNTTVTGAGTLFSNELASGYAVRIDTNIVVVSQVVSQTVFETAEWYPGTNVSGATPWLQPAFDSELSVVSRIVIDDNALFVKQIGSSSNFTLMSTYPGPTTNGLVAYRTDGNPTVSGDKQYWHFLWTNMTAGYFRFVAMVDTNNDTGTVEAQAVRNTTVIFREMVADDPDDYDDDDDGLYDNPETSPTNLPSQNPETWNNGDVHIWAVYGRTGHLLPDTDGDGLPDGLESGWRSAGAHTDTGTDTDGDGYPNFRVDYDPPFYNTVPDNSGVPDYVFYDSRTKLIQGSMTDASNKDSDYDGLSDGVEDRNRNGWADGDGKGLPPGTNWWEVRFSDGDWPDGEWDANWAVHPDRETDPNRGDTDADGASDGYGEDTDFSGWINGDDNSNRTWDAGFETWTETDPLNPDTDGDGLPDGWEKQYSLDALDDGILGHTNMQTGAIITTNEHGASGNPDGDTIVVGSSTNDYTNIMEFENGTNPRVPDTGDPPPEGSITIGRGDPVGVLAGVTQYQYFVDWTWDDCLILDEYEGDGGNNQGGDVYKGWDGFDESRDIVAFYAHDGGDVGNGGDGKFYFRVDFHDLRAHAEDENLDLYVVLDTGNKEVGEMSLPDEVDTLTYNRWEAVVAVYKSSSGRVYIDTKRSAPENTTEAWQNPLDTQYGVVGRDENQADGFIDAYFDATLDSVEFCISRQALLDAGWGGTGASNFNYQVFTTKDGTGNDPVGAGDIGGRSDVRDCIVNDKIAEDYWIDQEGLESKMWNAIAGTWRANRAKISFILHGNQAIQPGTVIQRLINTDSGAGYYRPLDVHDLYDKPVNLHITATLASAMQWASVDPAAGKPWLDGPAFNRRIAQLVDTNVVYLLGSTFSDHVLPYFRSDFCEDNERLARRVLDTVYDTTILRNRAVFWTPERVLDGDVLAKIAAMGYGYTVFDQDTHLRNWYGRTESLIDGAYRLNEFAGSTVKAFAINEIPTSYLFVNNDDGGLAVAMRALLNRKARSGTQDQVVTLFTNWEAFQDNDDADAYDENIRWLANRPWTEIVALEQIAADEVDAWGDPGGDAWGAVSRAAPGYKQGHNWLNHATREDFDNWYTGSAEEESLEDKVFEIRPGTNVAKAYGMEYFTGGIVRDTWDVVGGIADTNIEDLARAVVHASTFQTAFHNEDNHDLRRYSTGSYMVPATSSNALADFVKAAQAQTRTGNLYDEVDDWAALAAGVTTAQTVSQDVDMDGEPEYLLYNDRLFAVFERIGGRMVGAWVRDILSGKVYQALGNQAGYAGSETEREGAFNVETNGDIVAFRTSGLKDWWVADYPPGSGSLQFVNDQLYNFTAAGGGWRIESDNGMIRKTVTLGEKSGQFDVQYELMGDIAGKTLYVRHGLSPNLFDLLVHGQAVLGDETHDGGVMTLANTGYVETVTAIIGYSNDTHNTGFNTGAGDDDPGQGVTHTTVPMRNQAQTHQVELYGSGTFSFSMGFTAGASDWDGDGMPNTYEDQYGFLDPTDPTDGTNDHDSDLFLNAEEYVGRTAPDVDTEFLRFTVIAPDAGSTGIVVQFPAKTMREYRVWYDSRSLLDPAWSNATPTPIVVDTNQVYEWVDDGSTTDPDPWDVTNRFYDVQVTLPQ